MGQQETMTLAAEKAGGALRRIVLALTVAAVMALMIALAAAEPALAKSRSKVNRAAAAISRPLPTRRAQVVSQRVTERRTCSIVARAATSIKASLRRLATPISGPTRMRRSSS